jgi:thiol-disulfide isomerase/thioredoxin
LTVAILLAVLPAQAADTRPFGRGSWAQLRTLHQGQPIVVHFWGVTCPPCLGELPKWGQLLRERPKAGIVFVASDPVPVERSLVEAAMAKAGIADGENWMFDGSFVERLHYEVNPDWGGEMPYTAMIDRTGRASFVAGVMDLNRIREWFDRQSPQAKHQEPTTTQVGFSTGR